MATMDVVLGYCLERWCRRRSRIINPVTIQWRVSFCSEKPLPSARPMLRVDDNRSVLSERLLSAIDRSVEHALNFRGLGRYLMPQLRVTGLARPITPLLPGNVDIA